MINYLSILLETTPVVTDSLANKPNGIGDANSLSILDLVVKGGPIMLPLLILFLGALYLFIERYLNIRRASRPDKTFMNQIQTLVESGRVEDARMLCKEKDTPTSRVLEKGLRKLGRPIDDIEKALESAGKLEVYKLENNLTILSSIAAIAPMFGFVGTIYGVIIIFHDIQAANNIEIGIVAGGLYKKMITSASGLIVGIIAYIFYHYLLLKIDKEIYKMEANAIEFLDLLQEPTE
jgi:biopolymer transport protein ExbB